MQNCSLSEENYLKAIYGLSLKSDKVLTNDLAEELDTKPASISNMLKKLAEKELIHYEKYHGVTLTEEGHMIAVWILRKHRLWETFLMVKLGFAWDKVHLIAEQLEHIKSEELIEKLDDFLDNPQFDPHGAPIPDKNGHIPQYAYQSLDQLEVGASAVIKRVKNGTPSFLKYLDRTGLQLDTKVHLQERFEFDSSLLLQIGEAHDTIQVSKQAAENLMMRLEIV